MNDTYSIVSQWMISFLYKYTIGWGNTPQQIDYKLKLKMMDNSIKIYHATTIDVSVPLAELARS